MRRQSVPALIYPSHEGDSAKSTFVVGWYGWYVGSVEASNGQHTLGVQHRPQTTAEYPSDNLGHWAAFWHVKALRELPKDKHIAIGEIGTIKGAGERTHPLVVLSWSRFRRF